MTDLSRMFVLIIALFVIAAVAAGSRTDQATKSDSGKFLQVKGTVAVNGTSAISGATVFSDSTVTTAARSSAVVSLGNSGRVEVLPQTTMKLNFGDSDFAVAVLDASRVGISSSSNLNAGVTPNDCDIKATGRTPTP